MAKAEGVPDLRTQFESLLHFAREEEEFERFLDRVLENVAQRERHVCRLPKDRPSGRGGVLTTFDCPCGQRWRRDISDGGWFAR